MSRAELRREFDMRTRGAQTPMCLQVPSGSESLMLTGTDKAPTVHLAQG